MVFRLEDPRLHGMAPRVAQSSRHDRVHGVAGTASQALGLNSMSAPQMTLERRKPSASANWHRLGRQLWLAVSLVVLAVPLSGCGTGALWDKFMAKDDTFVEEPADKLYNEGLYLMNQKSDPKEIGRAHV